MKNANGIINDVDGPPQLSNGKNDVELRVVGVRRTSHPLYSFDNWSMLLNSLSQSQV